MEDIDMKMHHVELIRLPQDLIKHQDVMRRPVLDAWIEPQGLVRA